MSVTEAIRVCHRWHTQCESFSCWAWKLWLWQTQRGGSTAATTSETSCSLRITSTCQVLPGRTRCVGTMMTGTAQKPREDYESKTCAPATPVSRQLLLCPIHSCNASPGLEFDSLACRMRMIVTWGLWPSKRQKSRAATASCRKGFTACWLDRHMRPLQSAEPCRCWGPTLWVSTAPSCSLKGTLMW